MKNNYVAKYGLRMNRHQRHKDTHATALAEVVQKELDAELKELTEGTIWDNIASFKAQTKED